MKKEIRQKCLKKRLPAIVICLIAACVLLGLWLPDVLLYFRGPQQLSELSVDQLSGAYVEAEINGIYDWYAQDVESSGNEDTIVAREYLIPVGEYEYMSLYMPQKYLEEADALMDQTQSYLMDPTSEITGSMTVTGTILPMEEESLQYYHEYLEYDDMDAELQELFLPLYLRVDYVNTTPVNTLFFLVIAGVIFLAVAVILIVLTMTRGGQKDIKAVAERSGNPEVCEARMENFYSSIPEVNGLRAGGDYMMFWTGASFHVLESPKVLWAYGSNTTHKLYGIVKTGVTRQIVIRTDDGKTYSMVMKSEEMTEETLQYIQNSVKHVIIGYTDELAQLFKTDIERFKQLCRQKELEPTEG